MSSNIQSDTYRPFQITRVSSRSNIRHSVATPALYQAFTSPDYVKIINNQSSSKILTKPVTPIPSDLLTNTQHAATLAEKKSGNFFDRDFTCVREQHEARVRQCRELVASYNDDIKKANKAAQEKLENRDLPFNKLTNSSDKRHAVSPPAYVRQDYYSIDNNYRPHYRSRSRSPLYKRKRSSSPHKWRHRDRSPSPHRRKERSRSPHSRRRSRSPRRRRRSSPLHQRERHDSPPPVRKRPTPPPPSSMTFLNNDMIFKSTSHHNDPNSVGTKPNKNTVSSTKDDKNKKNKKVNITIIDLTSDEDNHTHNDGTLQSVEQERLRSLNIDDRDDIVIDVVPPKSIDSIGSLSSVTASPLRIEYINESVDAIVDQQQQQDHPFETISLVKEKLSSLQIDQQLNEFDQTTHNMSPVTVLPLQKKRASRRELSACWKVKLDSDGEFYYLHKVTGEVSYSRPES